MIGKYIHLAHQGIANPYHSMANGGGGNSGGGSSNPDTRYSNLDALYGVQTQASRYMLDNAMPNVPIVTENSSKMVSDAMDGTLATQLRDRAGADSAATMGAALDANQRNMQRFGMGFNANRLLSENNKNAIMGAAQKTAAMNKADQFAEDQKWNRNAGFFGQVTGMNSGAMQGLSSAGNGMGNVAYQQSLSDQKNAAGYGQAGSQFASSLFKADGGYIEKPAKLASGGDAWAAYKAANPVVTSSGSSGGSRKSQSGFSQMLGGAAPAMLGAGLKDVLNLDGKGGKLVKAGKNTVSYFQKAQEAQQAAQQAEETAQAMDSATSANAAVDSGSAVGATADVASGADYAYGGYETAGAAMDGATSATAAADAGATVGATADVASGADYMGQTTSSFSDASSLWAADGGYIKKNRFAMGGLTGSSVASSNKVDGTSAVANMDASSNMIVAKMDDVEPTKKPTLAVPVGGKPAYDGDTEGMGETSTGDKDGFGSKSADNRHLAGSTTIKTVGNRIFPFLGTVLGDTVADAIHPIMEPVTRNGIMIGDTIGRALTGNSKAGGAVGAFLTDPIGAAASGKYFADGGETNVEREDFTPGGEVAGPGTETSDDIPAWLSDGEIVHNADAVDLAGKEALLAINEEGLKARRGEKDPEQAKQDIGKVMIERGKELVSGNRIVARGLVKHGVKLAGGGFLGGNMGIAMGAGVDQYNKQQMIDQHQQSLDLQKQNAARQEEEFGWKRTEREKTEALKNDIATIAKNAEAAANPEKFMAKSQDEAKAAAEKEGIAYEGLTPEQQSVIRGNLKPDRSAEEREYANAFRKYGNLEAASALEAQAKNRELGTGIGKMMKDGAKTRDLLGTFAEVNPGKALEMQIRDENIDAKLNAIAANNAAKLLESERRTQAMIDRQYGGGRSGSGSGSGSRSSGGADEGTKSAHGIIDKLASNDVKFAGTTKEAPEVTGLDLHPIARTFYSDIINRSGNKLSPERAALMSIELAKSSKGLPSEYSRQVVIDENGDFSVTARNVAGKDDAVLSRNIGNPESFLGGTKEEKAKLLAQRRADAALNFFGSPENAREMASKSPDDVKQLVVEAKKRNPNLDERAFAERINKYIAHAKVFAQQNPPKPVQTPAQEFSRSWEEQTKPLGYRVTDAVGGVAQALNPFRTGSIEENRQRSREGLITP